MPRIIFSLGAPVICGGTIVPCQIIGELRRRGYDAFAIADWHEPELEKYCGTPFRTWEDLETDETDIIIAVRWEQCEELEKYQGRKIQFVQGNDRAYYEMINHTDLQKMLDKRNDPTWELIGVSDYVLQDFQSGVVIPNGIDDRFFVNLGLERDIDALVIGNNEKLKNVDYAIEMAKQDGHKKIVWMGRETKPVDGVECITNPPQDIIPSIYQRSRHVYIYSLSEGFSLPLWEAAASGCIVHTHDMGPNKDWVYTREEAEKYTWKNSVDKLLEYLKV